MARLYDLMLLLDPDLPEERRTAIVSSTQTAIESDGSLIGSHDWGTRRLAYEIDHRPEAAYHLFQFEGNPELLQKLDHSLKIADGVLRFRTIRLKPGTPPPPSPSAETPRPRADQTDVAVAPRAAADAPAPERDAPPPEGDAPAPEPAAPPSEPSE